MEKETGTGNNNNTGEEENQTHPLEPLRRHVKALLHLLIREIEGLDRDALFWRLHHEVPEEIVLFRRVAALVFASTCRRAGEAVDEAEVEGAGGVEGAEGAEAKGADGAEGIAVEGRSSGGQAGGRYGGTKFRGETTSAGESDR